MILYAGKLGLLLAVNVVIDSTFITAVFGFVISAATLFMAYTARQTNKVAIETNAVVVATKEVADTTHTIVNSQKTAMEQANQDLFETVQALRAQIAGGAVPQTKAEREPGVVSDAVAQPGPPGAQP